MGGYEPDDFLSKLSDVLAIRLNPTLNYSLSVLRFSDEINETRVTLYFPIFMLKLTVSGQ